MPDELELDPEKLYIDDPDIPDAVEDDDDGHQEDSDADEETESADEDSQDASGDEDESEESDEDEDEAGEQQDGDTTADDGEAPPEGDVFEINGEEYTTESLSAKLVELERGSLRQSDYTTKTQALAEQRKSIEANVAFVEQLKKADLMESIQEALKESGIPDADKLVGSVLNGVPVEHPDTQELMTLKEQLKALEDEKEAETLLEKEMSGLIEKKKISASDATEVRKFAEELYNTKGTVLDLEEAYDLWRVRKGDMTVKRKQPSIPKTPDQKKGTKPNTEQYGDRMEASKLFI
jgi:hypothetical protein